MNIKRFINVKNIFTWVTAIAFVVAFIVALCSKMTLTSTVTLKDNVTTDTVTYVIGQGTTVFNFTETVWGQLLDGLHKLDSSYNLATLTVTNNIYIIGAILLIVPALSLIGATLLKKGKVRTLLYVASIVIGVAALVFIIVGQTQIQSALEHISNETYFFNQTINSVTKTTLAEFLKANYQSYSIKFDPDAFAVPMFIAIVSIVLIVPSMIIRSPKVEQ